MSQDKGRPRDRGASALEYAGLVVLASALIGALYATGVIQPAMTSVQRAICQMLGGECSNVAPAADDGENGKGGQPEKADNPALTKAYAGPGDGVNLASASSPSPDGKGLDHDRRDAGRDAYRERETDEGRIRDEDPKKPNEKNDPAPSSGLGEPQPGEKVKTPKPPKWSSPDPGAGEHGSDNNPVDDYFVKSAAEAGAHALSGKWPDASRNLLHFLGNSGEPLEQDVDKMLKEVPEFRQSVNRTEGRLGATAIEKAKKKGAKGPLTFPVNTKWSGTGAPGGNWFYATGSWQYNTTGQVTVYPPSKPGGKWRYKSNTKVNYRDQYNWDGGKGVQIGPLDVSDEQLAELHRAGVAREYMMYGQSKSRTTEGTG